LLLFSVFCTIVIFHPLLPVRLARIKGYKVTQQSTTHHCDALLFKNTEILLCNSLSTDSRQPTKPLPNEVALHQSTHDIYRSDEKMRAMVGGDEV
jgi:hypothetical protein